MRRSLGIGLAAPLLLALQLTGCASNEGPEGSTEADQQAALVET
jgi:hypothetical protein